MEWIETKALKSSFLSEIIGMKSTTPQGSYFDDLWRINSVVDEFSVDDLLDLSDKNFSGDSFEESSEEDFDSVSSQDNYTNSMNSNQFSISGDDHLTVPSDDMENLEWLSQIVDDSVPVIPVFYPSVKLKTGAGKIMNRVEPVLNMSSSGFTVLGLSYPVPRKCRTQRLRKPGQLWLAGSFTKSSSNSSSSITSPTLFGILVYSTQIFEKQPATKKQRKSPANQNGLGSSESLGQRQCTHCQVQKTPQWRTGPLGPKTLCNACGVRFKSGRLYPEYRPVCSPTFSSDIHSNNHRKVMELRKKEREVGTGMNMKVQ